ncbi:hypothetical protein D1815_04445 [Aquimarina sp. AD1]|uniref:hypothetical protein n=1 Tax=Aquimarina sp. (strain AD1) TaxID=1714848 RepID=UPI000E47B28B|nr:hypothetical protein [Aquimarina sp. AD1]AXT55041.1 hypothetical protein D1815_04445 [Aquimarina sp. AD1]RKN22939.1 hypothetical protein D7035_11965 [Aquimarina sp. AD1]
MDTLKLHAITYSEDGHKINYEYSVGANIQKLFTENELFYVKYQIDVSKTPLSIAVIPFLSNVLPMAWFAGFTIEIDEVDEDFYRAQEKIKQEFAKRDTSSSFEGTLVAKKLIKNSIEKSKSSMLFSGGVDAFATYIRIYDQKPDLITLHGADITIKDKKQWNDFTDFIENEELLNDNNKEFIETNLRDFYTYQVELLLNDIGWWGKVQHGLALVGSIAPLSFVNKYGSVHIASSYTDHIDIDWGSTPEIDEKITWGSGFKVFHDGYELKRQDKVDLIAKFASEKDKRFRLRVCYSEKRTEFNCSYCEKCFRTILGLILNNQNPNEYGFNVDSSVYDKIYQILHIGSGSKGVKYFWWELMEKAKNVDTFFVFDDLETETKHMNDFRNGKVDRLLEEKLNNANKGTNRLKFIIRNKFPWLQKIYRKFK